MAMLLFIIKATCNGTQIAFSHNQRTYSAKLARSSSIIQKNRFLKIDTLTKSAIIRYLIVQNGIPPRIEIIQDF